MSHFDQTCGREQWFHEPLCKDWSQLNDDVPEDVILNLKMQTCHDCETNESLKNDNFVFVFLAITVELQIRWFHRTSFPQHFVWTSWIYWSPHTCIVSWSRRKFKIFSLLKRAGEFANSPESQTTHRVSL